MIAARGGSSGAGAGQSNGDSAEAATYWWTIQSMAFRVVLFTLRVQATTMPVILRRLELTERAS